MKKEVPEDSYYVVIGAFSLKSNAVRFVSYAQQFDMEATYEQHQPSKLYYVYVYKFDSKEDAIAQTLRLQKIPEFSDTWFYKGTLTGEKTASSGESPAGTPSNPLPSGQETPEPSENQTETGIPLAKTDDITDTNAPKMEGETTDVPIEEPLSEKEETKTPSRGGKSYKIYPNTISISRLREVKGNVEVIDPIHSKKIDELAAHTLATVENPNNGNNTVKLSTNIFGFKPVEHIIDLENPLTDSTAGHIELAGDSIIVNFDLMRYQKGDIIVMYQVYFFKDAAIMRPESKYELNSLLEMMKENEKYKIRIHGHTNGNSHGKIISLNDADDTDFFSLSSTHKTGVGSAKKLSEQRANTIKRYLVSKGIAENRLFVKGWGGKKMLYGKHSTQAKKNVRVEVEILEE